MPASERLSVPRTNATLVEIDGENASPPGHDRRSALIQSFVLCLAVGSAFLGRDGPEQIAPVLSRSPHTLALPAGAAEATLFAFPDRLANEPLPSLPFVGVRVRAVQGLAVPTSVRNGSPSVVTWTENGTWYWLSSPRQSVDELIDLADRLR